MTNVNLALPPEGFLKNPPFVTLYLNKSSRIRSKNEIACKAYKLTISALKNSEMKFPFSLEMDHFESIGDIKFKNVFHIINSSGEVFTHGIPSGVLEDAVFVGNFPKIRQYLKAVSIFERLLVCIVERAKAEFFIFDENDFLSIGWLSEEVPKRVKYGGLLGFEENRIRRHVEHHELLFLEKVARVCTELARAQKINLVGIGLKDDLKSEADIAFGKNLVDLKYFYFPASTEDTPSELLRKLDKRLQELKKEELIKIIDSNLVQVISEDEVVKKFNLRQINTLVLSDSKILPGYFCPNDFFVSTIEKSCDFCSNELLYHDDIFEIILVALYYNGGRSYFDDTLNIMIVPKAS